MIKIYDSQTDELLATLEDYELSEFFIDNICTKEAILESFDEFYEPVQTPMGEVSMSALMEGYMTPTDWRCILNDEADFREGNLTWYDEEDGTRVAEDYGYRFVLVE